jgi:uncharacterized membrane protein
MKHVTVAGTTFQRDTVSSATGTRTIHQSLAPFPVAYFTAAFVTDLAYWRTAEVMWERFSVWLITGGLIMAAVVAVAAVIDLASRRQKPAWLSGLSYTLAVVLSLLNVLVHSRDGYTAVVPIGLTLSAIVFAILMLFTFTAGWSLTTDRGDRR